MSVTVGNFIFLLSKVQKLKGKQVKALYDLVTVFRESLYS